MENNDANELARLIRKDTSDIVENSKNPGKGEGIYRTDLVSTLEHQNGSVSDEERKAFSESLVNGIKNGTEEQKKYDQWYLETYGTKNQHVDSNSVVL